MKFEDLQRRQRTGVRLNELVTKSEASIGRSLLPQEKPTLKKYSYEELEDIILRHARWKEIEEARRAGADLTDLPDFLPRTDEHDEIRAPLEPVSEEILKYIASCPDEEWDEFYANNHDEELVLRAREDVNVFLEYCFRDKDDTSWTQQSFHRDWHLLLPSPVEAKRLSSGEKIHITLSDGIEYEKSLTTLIGAPREHAKTTQMSVGRVIWELGRNMSLRVKIVTASDGLAKDIVFDIAQNIERNPYIAKVFPELKPDYAAGWTKSSLYVKRPLSAGKDASVEASSVLGTGAGGRADILVFDDVIDFRNAVGNPALRDAVRKAIEDVWIPLMPADGRCWYSATPWHNADYTHEIKKREGWAVWWKPAYREETQPDGTTKKLSLWPGKWHPAALETRQKQIGPRAFTRQFLLIALSDDEATFHESVIVKCYDYERRDFGEKVDPKWPRYCGVDLASSFSKKAAYTVVFTIAVEPETSRRIPVEMIRDRLSFPQLIEIMVQQYLKHKWELVLVENNQYQAAVVQQLPEEDVSIPVQGFRTGSGKMDEEVGLPGLATVFSNGGWSIPMREADDHGTDCPCNKCVWVQELRTHPLAEFSDTVMATWFAERAAVQGGSQYEEYYFVTTGNAMEEEARKERELKLGLGIDKLTSMTAEQIRVSQMVDRDLIEKAMWSGAYGQPDEDGWILRN